jgi:hypothetical protein
MFAAMDARLPDLDQLDSKALKSLILSQREQLASRDVEIEHLKLLIAKLASLIPPEILLSRFLPHGCALGGCRDVATNA